jgi:ATP-dependent Clp protease protease subunit
VYTYPRKNKVRDNELASAAEIVISERRALFLFGPIMSYGNRSDAYSPMRIIESLLALGLESRDPIVMFISSPGGEVGTGMELYDAIRLSPAPVTTIGFNCASLATLVLAAGQTRLLLPHARVMLHLPRLTASDLKNVDSKELDLVNKERGSIRDIMADCYIETGVKRTRKQLLVDMDRMHWMNATEAKTYGLIDRVATGEDLYDLGKAVGLMPGSMPMPMASKAMYKEDRRLDDAC